MFSDNLEEDIYEATGVQICERLHVLLYPAFTMLYSLEEFDSELVELLWWGLEGQGDMPSSAIQFKKLAFKVGSMINPVLLMNNFQRNVSENADKELKADFEKVAAFLTENHF
mmetsp:Transcript_20069/g.30847  ORF Transcript_20069/g.30847 Transcript_20069/m.30847 type:complete len:113 (-) Transcript_20069:414-752(-)|eukprot:CAMPEP_0170488926 /NCGR_PEP_ID=MMETSP0208-20121228/7351_1 /TAXON_ID=197538 /ORGANISM="Strombidium inclinatum, Strain S3" /LENGTH=112 /DNA_ID=CAMNT_0010763637 /DNA_START=951 /DNA_END=1289 /DNA_ORIENTATION=+